MSKKKKQIGRPRLGDQPRKVVLSLRITASELSDLHNLAKGNNLKVAEYVRRLCFGEV